MSDLIADVRAARRLPSHNMARAIRENASVTQQQLADAVGVHRVTLARWEAGTTLPRGKLRARYARLLAELQRELAA
ncbi:helix-turn-helix domain-containing protein [Nocardioides rotundus]|uniref:helix-turn-helix transcriptional regulator n=1 Tax=Nocardioides rotundus TaxID=1774216 RepID=UPI001CBE03A7|nr:helix-turn-helix transcriptional regulator [Nocardioides rotundus]UAL31531.1 helix-turn-helix domain-containing protein [Nocardioides rotundus]